MTNEQKNVNQQDTRIAEALFRMGKKETTAPSQLTRARHLTAMRRARSVSRTRSLIAVAAAVALISTVGLVTSRDSKSAANLSAPSGQPLDLKKVDFVAPVPFERTEEYVMLTVTAQRAKTVAAELFTTLGADAPIIGADKKGTTFVVPASAARALNDTSGVVVVADSSMKSFVEQSPVPSWGLDRLDANPDPLDDSYEYFSNGAGSLVYVIDTGVYSSHSDFGGRIVPGYSAIDDGSGTEDCNGHGTHVAGTIAGSKHGVAKSATVVAVRVLDCSGSGYSSSVVAGINWAVASHPGGPGVINLSLGGAANSAVDDAIANATAAGLVVVVAAGNSSDDACKYSPARASSAITVAATDQSDSRASYSNFGTCVDLHAPGSGITSTWISASTATRSLSGTSMASPHIAGLAARLLQVQPNYTGTEIRDRLTAGSSDSTFAIANYVEADPGIITTTTSSSIDTTTSVPTNDTSTTVPTSTSTTIPRGGESDDKKKDKNKPNPAKKLEQPRQFSIRYETREGIPTLVALWVDNGDADSYQIACENLKGKKTSENQTTIIVQSAAIVRSTEGQSETVLAISPKESMKCTIVAFLGEEQSKESNQAVLPAQSEDSDDPPTTSPSTTVVTTTTEPQSGPTTTVSKEKDKKDNGKKK